MSSNAVQPISERASQTLMIASVLATALVISIHYNSRSGADVHSMNYLFQEFLTNGVARAAVPYFALVAGFFFARSSLRRSVPVLLREKARTLLLPYVLAAALIFVGLAVLAYRHHDAAFFQPRHVLSALTASPGSVQFWYLRDLLVLMVIAPLLGARSARVTPWRVGLVAVLGALWWLDLQFMPVVAGWYLINVETLFFFAAGCLLSARSGWLERVVNASGRTTALVLVAWLAVVAARVWLEPTTDVWYVRHYSLPALLLYKLAIGLGVVSLIQLSARLRAQRWLISLSGLTFFVFLFHCEPLRTLLRALLSPLHLGAALFYVSFPLALVIAFGVGALLASGWPWLYGVLTGSRTPDRALRRTQGARPDVRAPIGARVEEQATESVP